MPTCKNCGEGSELVLSGDRYHCSKKCGFTITLKAYQIVYYGNQESEVLPSQPVAEKPKKAGFMRPWG